ncbi:MAG: gliding motility-associated protein GldE [Ferruginibacter sp.]|nr:gliding motility-associated protein GldE [Cytophagales bacterium]
MLPWQPFSEVSLPATANGTLLPVAPVPLLLASVLVGLLILSAVISGAEVAFFSLSADERARCRQGDDRGVRIAALLDNPGHLLAILLIGNYFFNFLFVLLAAYLTRGALGQVGPQGAALAVAVTLLLVFLGEITPKAYARPGRLRFARQTVRLVEALSVGFQPLAWLLLRLSKAVEERAQRKGYKMTVEDLNLALETTTGGPTTEEEKEILKGIVNFGTISAKQIMRSRMDITAFDVQKNFHELMDKINKFGYSRIPVYRDTIDRVEGILYIKELLPYLDQDERFEWQKLLRPGFFIPENKKIDDLLYDFQEKRVHMAIVVDEYGGTSGLITLEDIIEEIVGEIHDEFDEDDRLYSRVDDRTYLFEGKISINDFCKVLEVDGSVFDEARGESESLAGLLLELFSRLPRSDEQISYRSFTFRVMSVDAKKIRKVKVQIGQPDKTPRSDAVAHKARRANG